MDKTIKEETVNQNEESSQTPTEDEELHVTHFFKWCQQNKPTTAITCNKAGTIENSLKTSSQFREIANKNKDNELVIAKDGKAISSHFPCSLITRDELLTINYVKKVQEPNQAVHPQKEGPSGEIVMFDVVTKGAANVKKIMRNSAIESAFQEITVYAYQGENVEQALRRDGRLQDKVFDNICVLSDKRTCVTNEMSNLVDNLHGKTFIIKRLTKCKPSKGQPGSQKSDTVRKQDPAQQSTTTGPMNDNTPKEKPGGNEAPEQIFCELLSSEFTDLVKQMNTKRVSNVSRIQNLFRVEYGKNAQTCREVKIMKKLMNLSNLVCQVRINERAEGSGFLLFDKFVLTNGHVIKNIYDERTGQLREKVTVHFSYESLGQMKGRQESRAEVEEVAGFECGTDVSRHMRDWALLKLSAVQKLPDVLLKHFGFLPPNGGICIIGHPEGGVKRIDPCFIVPTDNRNKVVERHSCENPKGVLVDDSHYNGPGHIQLVGPCFFEDVVKSLEAKRQILTYETCFYFGSSGSPVFDEHCNVVAMHSGGYVYTNEKRECNSVIEFGYPLSVIIENIIVQIVERERFDVLKEYLACGYARQRDMMINLKRLVESRNPTAFEHAASNSVVTNDKSLKDFFTFISQREQPVPMDS